LEDAHATASDIEAALNDSLSGPIHVTTHLEPFADHDEVHRRARAHHGGL
jgi:hypothetical protein